MHFGLLFDFEWDLVLQQVEASHESLAKQTLWGVFPLQSAAGDSLLRGQQTRMSSEARQGA